MRSYVHGETATMPHCAHTVQYAHHAPRAAAAVRPGRAPCAPGQAVLNDPSAWRSTARLESAASRNHPPTAVCVRFVKHAQTHEYSTPELYHYIQFANIVPKAFSCINNIVNIIIIYSLFKYNNNCNTPLRCGKAVICL